MNVISIGEVLWDIVGQEEHLGGATFNFSAHLSRLGHTVSFISAVGKDKRGQKVIDRMSQLDLTPEYLSVDKDHQTGTAAVALATDGQPKFVLHRPAAYDFPQLTTAQCDRLFARPVDWIYFGTLHQIYPQARHLTADLLNRASPARSFYDVNLRLDGYTRSDAEALVTRSLAAETETIGDVHGGKVLLDVQPIFKFNSADVAGQPLAVTGPISDESDYGSWNADMVKAGDLLIARNIPTELDSGEMFVGDRSNLLGYFSWGSNDAKYNESE